VGQTRPLGYLRDATTLPPLYHMHSNSAPLTLCAQLPNCSVHSYRTALCTATELLCAQLPNCSVHSYRTALCTAPLLQYGTCPPLCCIPLHYTLQSCSPPYTHTALSPKSRVPGAVGVAVRTGAQQPSTVCTGLFPLLYAYCTDNGLTVSSYPLTLLSKSCPCVYTRAPVHTHAHISDFVLIYSAIFFVCRS
jgi:hypothetical protein